MLSRISGTMAGWLLAFAMPITALAQQEGDTGGAGHGELFYWHTPENTVLLALLGAMVFSILLGISLYRVLLRRQVKQGVHPHTLGWTLVFFVVGFDLWICFATLFAVGSIGLGYVAICVGLFLFALLLMLFLGKVLKSILLFVLLLAGLAVFQSLNS